MIEKPHFLKDIPPKTIEEHRDYLYGIVRLKLFFLHRWMAEHPQESFSSVLRNRVDIYRKTSANRGLLNPVEFYFDESPWIDMERAAEAVYQQEKNDIAAFEEKAFQVFKPSLDERLEKDYHDRSGLNGYQCGSLRHEYNTRPVATEAGEIAAVGFHIANAVAPHSIFEDRAYLKHCLLDLCEKVESQFQAKAITTGTWLNQNPKWLVYFPGEWLKNLQAPNTNVQWHYGFWGQFISARGTLNRKLADILRKTGKLPYYPCSSWCSIASIRKHLETIPG